MILPAVLTAVLPEKPATAETTADKIAVSVNSAKCLMLFAAPAAFRPKFRSAQSKASQFIAVIAFKPIKDSNLHNLIYAIVSPSAEIIADGLFTIYSHSHKLIIVDLFQIL